MVVSKIEVSEFEGWVVVEVFGEHMHFLPSNGVSLGLSLSFLKALFALQVRNGSISMKFVEGLLEEINTI